RRRHTRSYGDWSSDVCSSDLRLNEHDVPFIDEIHRLDRELMEIVYPAMEDFQIDRIVRKEAAVKIDLAKFTMIAATTRPTLLTRSEERRVGKECRYRWAANDL